MSRQDLVESVHAEPHITVRFQQHLHLAHHAQRLLGDGRIVQPAQRHVHIARVFPGLIAVLQPPDTKVSAAWLRQGIRELRDELATRTTQEPTF